MDESSEDTVVIGEQIHHFYHNDLRNPTISVKIERNSKGYNFEASISGANSTAEALELLDTMVAALEERYPLGSKE